jgi:hypothetical protein
MEYFETIPTFALFLFGIVVVFVLTSVENRIVSDLKSALGKDAEVIGKNTVSIFNPLQNFTNMVFYFSYKGEDSTPKSVPKLIRIGMCLHILYFFLLAAVFFFMFFWVESMAW